ncbi:hypothetical protein QOL99_14085 [Deinococcus sp. MIMF12]|uniref:Integrase n=1 Tax=Deinococcus rhizophilus TaxID=3049544 RepID=A0ABT7JJM8_9DEIO|nr:hypothetical protein [Deinococcus rhizophilus]MDL2345268.1 hypothetical protein [Deinococcus rhizophilus]
MSLPDERSGKIQAALEQARLDELLPHVRDRLPVPSNTAFTLLSLMFREAAADGVNLLSPPETFHPWLLRVARLNHRGAEARPNTVRLRLSLLSNIYSQALQAGVLTHNPLDGLQRPPNERAGAPLLSREQIVTLHHVARNVPALHAALVLIDEHAYRVRELLQLQWDDFDMGTGVALRPHTVTRLSDAALQALQALHQQAGGLFARGKVFPYRIERDLRAALHSACRSAGVPYAPPSDLRRASLRDHVHSTHSAGFSAQVGTANLERATLLARGIVQKTGEEVE